MCCTVLFWFVLHCFDHVLHCAVLFMFCTVLLWPALVSFALCSTARVCFVLFCTCTGLYCLRFYCVALVRFVCVLYILCCTVLHCTMCTLYSFFSPRPSALGRIVQPHNCHIIEHIFVPTRSVENPTVHCTHCALVRGAVLSQDATRVNRGIYALLVFRLHFQTRISTLHLYLQ